MTPIGSLVTGWLINVATARAALGVGSLTAIVAGVVLGTALFRRRDEEPVSYASR
jgi:hypothetical protein